MKITDQMVRRIEISEVSGLDKIRVMLEDIGPGQGRINIECYGTSWATYWGGMGDKSIAQFFCSCDEGYIAGKLSSTTSEVFDPDGLSDILAKEIIAERRRNLMTKNDARQRYDAIERIEHPYSQPVEMQEILGDEWWYRLPMKPNPDYLHLTRIIRTVQEALRSINGGAA